MNPAPGRSVRSDGESVRSHGGDLGELGDKSRGNQGGEGSRRLRAASGAVQAGLLQSGMQAVPA